MRVQIRSVALACAIVCTLLAQAPAAPIVNLYYNPSTGNLTLQNTTAAAVSLQSYQVLTLGNGTYGAAAPGGQGYLTGTSALFPVPLASLNFPVTNTDTGGLNGLYSEVYAANFTTSILTLDAYAGWNASNPLGPAGSFFSLGNIAALGMVQADLNSRFITAPEVSPGETQGAGQFLFAYETSPGNFSTNTFGDVVAVVPEPGSLALTGIGVATLAWFVARRRRG
jgi:hypothetical protein